MERMNIMKEKVNVTGLPETMIQTLYARAKESGKENAKIHDDMAVEMVSRLDYDFSKADQDKAMSYGVIARTIVLDEILQVDWIQDVTECRGNMCAGTMLTCRKQ